MDIHQLHPATFQYLIFLNSSPIFGCLSIICGGAPEEERNSPLGLPREAGLFLGQASRERSSQTKMTFGAK